MRPPVYSFSQHESPTHLQRETPKPTGQFFEPHIIAPARLDSSPNGITFAHHKHVTTSTRTSDVQSTFNRRCDLLEPELIVHGQLEAFDERHIGSVRAQVLQVSHCRTPFFESLDKRHREHVILSE